MSKRLFYHRHPYRIFLPEGCHNLIIGTLPPPRQSTGALKKRDVDFCYGSCDNQLWPVLAKLFQLELLYDNSLEAVMQRKELLISIKTGICDIVESCQREEVNAQDLGMKNVVMRDIFVQLQNCSTIKQLIFTGGNSKNGPEYFFRKQAGAKGIKLEKIENTVPRKHRFLFQDRTIQTVSLTSPSNAANRAIGSTALYKQRKRLQPDFTPFDYRVEQYGKVFLGKKSNL